MVIWCADGPIAWQLQKAGGENDARLTTLRTLGFILGESRVQFGSRTGWANWPPRARLLLAIVALAFASAGYYTTEFTTAEPDSAWSSIRISSTGRRAKIIAALVSGKVPASLGPTRPDAVPRRAKQMPCRFLPKQKLLQSRPCTEIRDEAANPPLFAIPLTGEQKRALANAKPSSSSETSTASSPPIFESIGPRIAIVAARNESRGICQRSNDGRPADFAADSRRGSNRS